MPADIYQKAFRRVRELVSDFKSNIDYYLSPKYQEPEVRQDYLDKFLTALGWDVNHSVQKNPLAQEVKVERPVPAGESQRRADYAFFVEPNFQDVRFMIEAKKPHGLLATADNYFQANRYGWYKQIPLVGLTDFHELHLIDCRRKPDIKAALRRGVKKYHFTDYADPERFAEIYWLISREAVGDGFLEKYAATLPKPRGTRNGYLFPGTFQNIDESFLEELDDYRLMLARMFKRKNPELDSPTLTEITQRTLDRLVFMRFLEDKQIESDYFVAYFASKGSAWHNFATTSRRLDVVYNGVVFKRHEIIDARDFVVDEDAFAGLCTAISHQNTVYDFDEIPIHILGSIYERFLANVIVVTGKGKVDIERKPEVRRAGGVYYTPTYIVRYIVENTVGRLIEGRAPAQIAKMRFADIACGSGSFLLGIYDTLLRYHTRYYNENPGKKSRMDCVDKDGILRPSLEKKRQILLNNVYGADIDSQAVEVTELSLYLKLLEDETIGSIHEDRLLQQMTILPSLGKNITCGNSVIGTDISGIDHATERDLNPMSFEDRFPHVVPKPGFDAVVGNPPYVRPHKLSSVEKRYFWDHYDTFTHKSDLYCCFMERATRLLREGGMLSYIVSDGWQALNSFQELRRLILDQFRVLQLVDLPYHVFQDAAVLTGIFVLQKQDGIGRSPNKIAVMLGRLTEQGPVFELQRQIPQIAYHDTFQNVFDLSISPRTERIKAKMRAGPTLGTHFRVCFGLKTADDERFLHHGRIHAEDRPLLRGDDIKRYEYSYKGEYVWYVPDKMRRHRKTARPGEPERFEQPKVLVKDTSTGFAGTFESQSHYVKDVLIIIPRSGETSPLDLRAVAGLINSRALFFYYRTTFNTIHVQREELSSLPLPAIDLARLVHKERHDRLAELVDQMIEARRSLATAKSDKDRAYYENKAIGLDRQIDRLVYDLYALSSSEIKTIERALGESES